MKDPERLLGGLNLRFRDPVDARLAAKLDSTLRVWVGIDEFYFAGHATRDRFVKRPLHYCRTLTDPVTRVRFRPAARSPQLDYHGRHYYFAADSTRGKFLALPDFWALRGPADEARPMMPMAQPKAKPAR